MATGRSSAAGKGVTALSQNPQLYLGGPFTVGREANGRKRRTREGREEKKEEMDRGVEGWEKG